LSSTVTRLLRQWRDGNPEAMDQLFPLVYDELRRLARHYLVRERRSHTLQPTDLVHEAYLRLADKERPRWRDRIHFFAVSSQVMRRILVDHARGRAAAKRGGDVVRVSLDEARDRPVEKGADLLALDEALSSLESFDSRKSRIIELRFFGGLTIDETAEFLSLAPATIVKETRLARAWLFKHISEGTPAKDVPPDPGRGSRA
jgi:RNA polymerase sigma factor (TIGR02999 family)